MSDFLYLIVVAKSIQANVFIATSRENYFTVEFFFVQYVQRLPIQFSDV